MSDIRTWLEALGLGEHAEAFEAENITPALLGDLDDGDLKDLGLSMGHRKLVLKAAKEPAPAPTAPPREAERRQITVMFCDLVGSTALSEKLDPEDLRALMQDYQKAAGEVIERFGGHVAQYLGDGLMTYFGWPQAHEDDAERAVRASLDIVEAVGAMELQVRIGIATGPVVVGETGAGDASVPKLAVGETPNLAARLQGLAGADEIVVGPSTRRLLGGTFELAGMGEQALKGIVEPVPAHRVTGIAATEGRFEARHQHLTPLVGREAEMAMVMARWEQAKAGEGQVIVLGGEPGIGKSRITQALRERVADEPHTRLRYQCSPYHTNSALHPVIEQFERAAGFERSDTPGQKLDKLEPLVSDETARALIAALLSLPVERYPALAMSPQKQKEETLRVLAEQVTALAAVEPVLLIFEDAHWIDPTSQELLDLVVPMVAGHNVLAVITHRPEYEPPWTGQGHVSPLMLQRLGKAEAAAMVAQVSERPLSDDILSQIVAKTDGVPLFVEELTKTVQESGAETANAIPETLQDSLMARLDRLSPVKEVAQIGACIGREFSQELLAAVSPLNDNELGDALQQLVNSELIHRSGNGYTFKHALVQDSAYESLLKSRRQQLHLTIANTLVDRFADTVELQPELVAHHYAGAEQPQTSAGYWQRASTRALSQTAFTETQTHARAGLAILSEAPNSAERDRIELDLRNTLGTCLMASIGWTAEAVLETMEPAIELAEKLEDDQALAVALWGVWLNLACRGRLNESLKIIEKWNALAEQQTDTDLAIVRDEAASCAYFWMGRFDEGAAATERILKFYSPERHSHIVNFTIHDPKTIALLWSGGHRLWLTGYPDQASARYQDLLDYARAQAHPFDLAFSLTTGVLPLVVTGKCDECLAYCDEADQISKEQSMAIMEYCIVPWVRSNIHFELKNYEEAYALGKPALDIWKGSGAGLNVCYFQSQLAYSLANIGDIQGGIEMCEEAIEVGFQNEDLWYQAEAIRLRGEISLLEGSHAAFEAERYFRKFKDIAVERNAKSLELRAATSLARLWQSQGKAAEAHALLAPVYNWFTEGFDTPDLIEAKALLHELASG